jgi:hypothetical protein
MSWDSHGYSKRMLGCDDLPRQHPRDSRIRDDRLRTPWAMSMPSFKKILTCWKAGPNEIVSESSKRETDVTAFRCEEEENVLQLLDQGGTVVGEFGPGKEFSGWTLTVEYERENKRG